MSDRCDSSWLSCQHHGLCSNFIPQGYSLFSSTQFSPIFSVLKKPFIFSQYPEITAFFVKMRVIAWQSEEWHLLFWKKWHTTHLLVSSTLNSHIALWILPATSRSRFSRQVLLPNPILPSHNQHHSQKISFFLKGTSFHSYTNCPCWTIVALWKYIQCMFVRRAMCCWSSIVFDEMVWDSIQCT